MSQNGEQNLFFLSLPDLRKLCCLSLCLCSDPDDGQLRNKQVNTCRELLFLHPDIVASPALGSFGEITVVMAITFFKSGIIQAYTQRHNLQMSTPQRVLPSTLQVCLSYTLTAKLAPYWNKAGQYLVAGVDFLSDNRKLNAVVMQLSVNESQLCISVEASTVRLPPATLEALDVAPNVLRNFCSCRDAVIHSCSLPSSWCYILPSMKRGQIISISHQMPPECPFQSYADMQKHWSSLYGYRLPPVDEQDVVYCSVYFKLVGQRLFTYPLSCIRTEPIQHFPRVDLQGALSSFLSDVRGALQSVCGFPVRMTSKPCYSTTNLISISSQGSSNRPVNLTAKAMCRPVLTQLPSSFPQKPLFGGAPLERCVSQLAEPSRGSQHCRGGEVGQAAGAASQTPLTTVLKRSRPSSPPHSTAPRIVPIFKNKAITRHINITKILAERRQQSGEENRMSPGGLNRLAHGSAPSSQWRRETHLWVGQNQPDPPPQPCPSSHPRTENRSRQLEAEVCAERAQDLSRTLAPPRAIRAEIPSQIHSNTAGDWFESKLKKSKVNVLEEDVEKYARSNQLSKINAATLQAWLKRRGVAVRSKDRKEELVTKVMHCLSEP